MSAHIRLVTGFLRTVRCTQVLEIEMRQRPRQKLVDRRINAGEKDVGLWRAHGQVRT